MKTLNQARAERNNAMSRAEKNSSRAFRKSARNIILDILSRKETFIADDVWYEAKKRRIKQPREPRALGPIITNLLKEGIITRTRRFTQSKRRHATAMRIWKRKNIL